MDNNQRRTFFIDDILRPNCDDVTSWRESMSSSRKLRLHFASASTDTHAGSINRTADFQPETVTSEAVSFVSFRDDVINNGIFRGDDIIESSSTGLPSHSAKPPDGAKDSSEVLTETRVASPDNNICSQLPVDDIRHRSSDDGTTGDVSGVLTATRRRQTDTMAADTLYRLTRTRLVDHQQQQQQRQSMRPSLSLRATSAVADIRQQCCTGGDRFDWRHGGNHWSSTLHRMMMQANINTGEPHPITTAN